MAVNVTAAQADIPAGMEKVLNILESLIEEKVDLHGTISQISMPNHGSGYTLAPSVAIVAASGDTTGKGATATAHIDSGAVTSISVDDHGSGYTQAPTVTITNASGDTTGSGATATAHIVS